MFDHIGLKVSDLQASLRFYDAVLTSLGYERCASGEEGAGYGSRETPAFWLSAAGGSGAGAHLAFKAPDRRSVGAFHEQGLKAGGRDNGRPGLRPDYGSGYYAAFLIDPDGNNVEAVCLAEDRS